MDTRQTEIVEGQGLAESRLNTEFIQWLNVWLPRILYVVLAIVLVYSGMQWWNRYQVQQLDKAFAQLELARVSGSPDALEAVARDHRGKGSVAQVALLEAADAYLDQARRGMLPSADLESGEGVLTDEQVVEALSKADALYADLYRDTSSSRLQTIHVSARWGQASVAMQRGEFESAREMLGELARLGEELSLASIQTVAQETLDDIEAMSTLEPLISRDTIASETPRTEVNPTPLPPLPFETPPGGVETPEGGTSDVEVPGSLLDLQLPFTPAPRDTSGQEDASPPSEGDESGS
ncbi:MAG: hypothetical protein ACF8GE_06730 [Phycisphaerales bacterium JB043]